MVLAEIVNRGDVQGALRKNTHEIIRLNVDLYRRLSKMLGTEKSRKGVINEVEIVLKEESEICIC